MKVLPNIINNIVSAGILLQYEDETEEKLGMMNIKYKGTIINFIRSEKDEL